MSARSEVLAALRQERHRPGVLACAPGMRRRVQALIDKHSPTPAQWSVQETEHVPWGAMFLMPSTDQLPLFS